VIECKPQTNGLHKSYFSSSTKFKGYQVLKTMNVFAESCLLKNETDLFKAYPEIEIVYGDSECL